MGSLFNSLIMQQFYLTILDYSSNTVFGCYVDYAEDLPQKDIVRLALSKLGLSEDEVSYMISKEEPFTQYQTIDLTMNEGFDDYD